MNWGIRSQKTVDQVQMDEIVINMDGPNDPPDLLTVTVHLTTAGIVNAKVGDALVAKVVRIERRVVEQ